MSVVPDDPEPDPSPSQPAPQPARRPDHLRPVPQQDHRQDHPQVPEHSLAPRKPRTVGGVIYLGVLATTAVGLVVVTAGQWRPGLSLVGGALLAAGTARLVLPDSQAGMLGIRRKLVDVGTLLVLGGGLVLLASVIPGSPASP